MWSPISLSARRQGDEDPRDSGEVFLRCAPVERKALNRQDRKGVTTSGENAVRVQACFFSASVRAKC